MVSARDEEDLVDKARKGTLVRDDQRYQRLQQAADRGDGHAKSVLDEIRSAGGARSGSVNKVI